MATYEDLTAFFGADLATDMVAAPTYSQMSRPYESVQPHPYSDRARMARRATELMLDIREARRIEDRRAYESDLALAPANAVNHWGS
jgi:hypothetical protein